MRKLSTDSRRREALSAPCVRYLVKKVKATGILFDKPKREKAKTVCTPWILLLRQKVGLKRHQHQFTVVLNNWTFRRHTNSNWFRSWIQLRIQWFFASQWTSRRCRFWQKKNQHFRWSSFLSWRVCKQFKTKLLKIFNSFKLYQ